MAAGAGNQRRLGCDWLGVKTIYKNCDSKYDVTVHREEISELKIPYDTVLAAGLAELECEESAKSCCLSHMCGQ